MMTKRHYIKFAAMVVKLRKSYGNFIPSGVLNIFIAQLVLLFIEDNPKFDAGKFYKACGSIEMWEYVNAQRIYELNQQVKNSRCDCCEDE